MTTLKRWVRDLFGFSNTETNAFIILLPLMALLIMAQPMYQRFSNADEPLGVPNQTALDSLIAEWESEQRKGQASVPDFSERKVFSFDPNNVSADELRTLGFNASVIKRLVNYREQGGVFKIKSHLLKIYGMDTTLYWQLYSSIALPEKIEARQPEKQTQPDKIFALTKFNLNEADTAVLKKINGVGPVLARRIVKYRESLGGFVNVSQLSEVYGLDSTVSKRIIDASFLIESAPTQLNINEASEQELDIHPYINKSIAKALVTYRFQHGKFKSVDEIRNIVLIKKEVADKLMPYLKID